MSKSVNEYYAEKMNRLLEKQQRDKVSPNRYVTAGKTDAHAGKTANKPAKEHETSARKLAEKLNEIGANRPKTERRRTEPAEKPHAQSEETPKKPPIRYIRPTVNITPAAERIAPEQTARDVALEEKHKEYALEKAKRGKRLRRLRDALMSVVLVLSLFIIMLIIVYKLMFVITDIKVVGSTSYSEEAVINATGIREGENLYSFRSSVAKARISMRCPLISYVEIDRHAPNTIVITVKEESPRFYADFYGEYRAVSECGRVLYSISEEEAKKAGLIKLYLPTVKKALSGMRMDFEDGVSDGYIFSMLEKTLSSSLGEKVVSMDISNKYRIKFNISDKYLLSLGSTDDIDMKLLIAQKVMQDEVFANDEKALIDVSDLGETSVVFDHTIELK